MKRSITELKPHEVLWVAIWIERRNTAIYRNYADMFAGYDREIGQTFEEMAAEETRHGDELEGFYRRRFGNRECAITDEDVHEVVEAPVLPNGEVFITDSMRGVDALQVTLQAEKAAADFYRQMASAASDPELRALFAELAAIEVSHEDVIGARLAEWEAAAAG